MKNFPPDRSDLTILKKMSLFVSSSKYPKETHRQHATSNRPSY